MFKRQKTLFRGTTNLQKFYSRCIIGCYVIIRKKVKMTKKMALRAFWHSTVDIILQKFTNFHAIWS